MTAAISILSTLLAASVVALAWALVGRNDARHNVRILSAVTGVEELTPAEPTGEAAESGADGRPVAPRSIINPTVERMVPGDTFYAKAGALVIDSARAPWLEPTHYLERGPAGRLGQHSHPLEVAMDADGGYTVRVRSPYVRWEPKAPPKTEAEKLLPVARLWAPGDAVGTAKP